MEKQKIDIPFSITHNNIKNNNIGLELNQVNASNLFYFGGIFLFSLRFEILY